MDGPIDVLKHLRSVEVGGVPAEDAAPNLLQLERVAIEFAWPEPFPEGQQARVLLSGANGARELVGKPRWVRTTSRPDGSTEYLYRLEACWRYPAQRMEGDGEEEWLRRANNTSP